jgi:hypothetical protein
MTDAAYDQRGADRRMARVSFRYPERRSGFDRRTAGSSAWSRMLAVYRARPGLVAACAVAILVLSAVDLVLTHRLLALGATEANPLMAAALDAGVVPAAILKAAVTLPVAGAVWWLRRYRRVLELSMVVTGLLAALVVYQAIAVLAV